MQDTDGSPWDTDMRGSRAVNSEAVMTLLASHVLEIYSLNTTRHVTYLVFPIAFNVNLKWKVRLFASLTKVQSFIYIYIYVTAVARVFNAAETSLTCHREGHLFGYSNSGVQGVQGNCVFSDFGFA